MVGSRDQCDALLDLGCARGRLVRAAAATTAVAAAGGVELSPSDHADAEAARLDYLRLARRASWFHRSGLVAPVQCAATRAAGVKHKCARACWSALLSSSPSSLDGVGAGEDTGLGGGEPVEEATAARDDADSWRRRQAARLPPCYRCDLRDAPLEQYTVFYCAIRGDASRPAVTAGLVRKLLEAPPLPPVRAAGEGAAGGRGDGGGGAPPTPAPRRLILAGFGVDAQAMGCADRVTLARAYAVHAVAAAEGGAEAGGAVDAVAGAAEAEPASLPLYGDAAGPHVLLEYEIR